MALNDYILCARCDCKLIHDSPDETGDTNRQWWKDRFGKEPEFYCPPCQQAMAMARVQLLGQQLDDAKDGATQTEMDAADAAWAAAWDAADAADAAGAAAWDAADAAWDAQSVRFLEVVGDAIIDNAMKEQK